MKSKLLLAVLATLSASAAFAATTSTTPTTTYTPPVYCMYPAGTTPDPATCVTPSTTNIISVGTPNTVAAGSATSAGSMYYCPDLTSAARTTIYDAQSYAYLSAYVSQQDAKKAQISAELDQLKAIQNNFANFASTSNAPKGSNTARSQVGAAGTAIAAAVNNYTTTLKSLGTQSTSSATYLASLAAKYNNNVPTVDALLQQNNCKPVIITVTYNGNTYTIGGQK